MPQATTVVGVQLQTVNVEHHRSVWAVHLGRTFRRAL
jgi:hypothetical protein